MAGGLFVLPKMHKITQNSLLKKHGIFCLTFSRVSFCKSFLVFSGEVLYNGCVIIQERKRRMTDAIVQWLLSAGEGKFLATVLISMLPVIELRGGLPAGVAMGLPLREAFFAALLGNLLPVPFIILFARRGFAWVRAHIPRLGRWVDRIERKAWSKSDKVVRYQAWGLLLFVAVPLPGTGAWTGALIAALLDLRLKLAVPAITAGVFLAGIIISLLTYGAAALL